MGAQQHTSGTMVQQQQATAILDTTNTKCMPPSPSSPFSSRSLTPSPQQRVITPQPQVIHQVNPFLKVNVFIFLIKMFIFILI